MRTRSKHWFADRSKHWFAVATMWLVGVAVLLQPDKWRWS
jgi:hypothetical protein